MPIQKLQSVSKKLTSSWRKPEGQSSMESLKIDRIRIDHNGQREETRSIIPDGRANFYYSPNLFNTWGFF